MRSTAKGIPTFNCITLANYILYLSSSNCCILLGAYLHSIKQMTFPTNPITIFLPRARTHYKSWLQLPPPLLSLGQGQSLTCVLLHYVIISLCNEPLFCKLPVHECELFSNQFSALPLFPGPPFVRASLYCFSSGHYEFCPALGHCLHWVHVCEFNYTLATELCSERVIIAVTIKYLICIY